MKKYRIAPIVDNSKNVEKVLSRTTRLYNVGILF